MNRLDVAHHRRARARTTCFLMFLAASTSHAQPRVQTGIDVLAADGFKRLEGKRIGLITNPTGVTADLRSTIDVLANAPGVKLVALFGPEHGVRGDAPAGEQVADARDAATGLPAYSLYGRNRKPTPEMLKDVEVLVYDIQDIGCRSYTYISTMGVAMEAAAERGIPFYVLDRPNPLTGTRVEGSPLDPKHKSFVGNYPIPYVYGMTCGELARMINGEGWLAGSGKGELTVVLMRGWKRDMWFEQTGLAWVPTSPHVPRADSALFYAATGIMGELGVISEGVGYTLPFELAGAPGIEAEKFAGVLNKRRLPGVHFRAVNFQPFYGRYKDQTCGGAQIYITDRSRVHLTSIQFHIMDVVQQLYPSRELFGERRDAMFDKVCGTDAVRRMFSDHRPADDIVKFWDKGREEFMAQRAKYLLYD